MGLSSKKQKTTSKETIAPSAYSQPYIDRAVQGVTEGGQQSRDLLTRFLPQAEKSLGYYGDVMNGDYMDSNPYLENMISDTNQSVADSVNSQFSGAGRYGSDYHARTLADRIGANENNIRGGQYNTERGYMDRAAMGNLAGVQSIVGMPGDVANNEANAINSLLGRYVTSNGTSTTKSSGSLISQIAQAAQMASMIASDRRLKVDISRIGQEPDGLGVYQYRYVTDDPASPLRTGVMADEVEKLRPWALGDERGGFKTVNYGAL